jgi:hypothetical protein
VRGAYPRGRPLGPPPSPPERRSGWLPPAYGRASFTVRVRPSRTATRSCCVAHATIRSNAARSSFDKARLSGAHLRRSCSISGLNDGRVVPLVCTATLESSKSSIDRDYINRMFIPQARDGACAPRDASVYANNVF